MTLEAFKTAASRPWAAMLARVGAIMVVGASLAGCTDRLATGSTIPDSYQERHPIVLRDRPVTLNVFPGAKLDHVSKRRIEEFAANLREEGARGVEILVPVGAINDVQARSALPAIKAVFAEAGAPVAISVGSYRAADRVGMAPLRLSYRAVTAAVAHSCGQWPADLASGSSLETWENRPYWDLGCSYQNMIATQLEDPRDLNGPRATTPSDIQMRTRAIGKVRQGADPSSSWSVAPASIGK